MKILIASLVHGQIKDTLCHDRVPHPLLVLALYHIT